ncbi:STAS domain-containing protein [Alteraurantiacibacter aquimixticola]|uniref:STAS domain-containing protein n=1 Tax=Alteraurantiacibacter aquimixticola TaxID=2489173 RepID=A0A4V6UG99_9SPHN|nr:STAS domain-containing protein [Alteraurantiacibacter aquimixticola]TIX49067.1 STAS domain-containing protein [Alteraurantiacibacter aquimixticola]
MQTIELPPQCDRAAAVALSGELAEAPDTEPVRIDAGKVERIGLAMLQLLVAAQRSGEGIELVAASEGFRETVQLAGLDVLLANGAEA